MFPATAPIAVGVKVMVNVQVPPGGTGGVPNGQVVVNANGPVDVGALRTKFALPLLVNVTTRAGLVVLMVCGANMTGAPVIVMAGAGAATVRVALLTFEFSCLLEDRLPAATAKVYKPGVAL